MWHRRSTIYLTLLLDYNYGMWKYSTMLLRVIVNTLLLQRGVKKYLMDSAVFMLIVRKNVVFAIRSEQERIFRKKTLAKLSQKITSSFRSSLFFLSFPRRPSLQIIYHRKRFLPSKGHSDVVTYMYTAYTYNPGNRTTYRCDNVQCGCVAYECSIKLRRYMRR